MAEPLGSNPILARYTLSPVNHNSVLGMRQNGDENGGGVAFPQEPGMKPLRRTSVQA